jgi:hypothetical protein
MIEPTSVAAGKANGSILASGVPVGEMREYLGHATLSTTAIYMHFAPKRNEAQRLTEAFGTVSETNSGVAAV